MMEDFGHFGDESLFDSYQPEWLERSDDYNVWEEQQVFLDNEMDDDSDEIVESDDVAGFEDDGYESGLGLE